MKYDDGRPVCMQCGTSDNVRKQSIRADGSIRYRCNHHGYIDRDGLKRRQCDGKLITNKKTGVFNWREWTGLLEHRTQLHEKASSSQDNAAIVVNTDREWIIYQPISDVHIGALGCDYAAFREFTDAILSTDDCYISIQGDLADNFVQFKSQMPVLSQVLTPAEQEAFIESWLDEVSDRVLWAGWGNHEEFEERATGKNGIKKILSRRVVYFNGIGQTRLTVNGIEYNVVTTHKTRYNSSFNKTHGLKQLARKEIPSADIYISGHTHDPGFEYSFERGMWQLFVVLGSMKPNDGYAKRYFSPWSSQAMASIVINTKEKRYFALPSLQDAIIFRNGVESKS